MGQSCLCLGCCVAYETRYCFWQIRSAGNSLIFKKSRAFEVLAHPWAGSQSSYTDHGQGKKLLWRTKVPTHVRLTGIEQHKVAAQTCSGVLSNGLRALEALEMVFGAMCTAVWNSNQASCWYLWRLLLPLMALRPRQVCQQEIENDLSCIRRVALYPETEAFKRWLKLDLVFVLVLRHWVDVIMSHSCS